MNKLRKKISTDSHVYTKEKLSMISKDTTAKDPVHHILLAFLLQIDLQLFSDKAGIRNRIFEEICKIIPYTNKNHKNLTELVERFCATITDDEFDANVTIAQFSSLTKVRNLDSKIKNFYFNVIFSFCGYSKLIVSFIQEIKFSSLECQENM